ncbi:MAG TPA: hypothetical protein HPP94_02745 [Desulfuromonadales bacterium]|nr:hypothetical protein [Desulfuromonadales bacterium]
MSLTKLFMYIIIGCVLAAKVPAADAAESVRAQEINQCLSGEIMTWGDGRDRPTGTALLKFTYNPAGAPNWFSEALVAEKVAKAAAEWSLCGVRTLIVDRNSSREQHKGAILVQWSDTESGGNFGLAHLGKRTLSLGPKAFGLLKTRNPSYDSRETLQMVISHEMGHFFGLMAHSKRCVDVLSYYDNGKGDSCYSRDPSQMRKVVEYRSILPTACDIERCRVINQQPPLAEGTLKRK